jgi:hypothetical protein
MAACQVLYFDPTQVGRVPVDPFGEQTGPACDGWRRCPAQGRGWLDPTGRWRQVCPPTNANSPSCTTPASTAASAGLHSRSANRHTIQEVRSLYGFHQ